MTLYDLTQEYAYLMSIADDPDLDPQVFEDTLEGLSGEIEDKADGYAKVISGLTSQMNGLKWEIDRLTARRRAIENNIARMKENLKMAMISTGKTQFKTTAFSFNIQKNPPSVVVDAPQLADIPFEYLVLQEPKIDKVKLKDDLKAGKDLEGIAHLEQTEGVRIR